MSRGTAMSMSNKGPVAAQLHQRLQFDPVQDIMRRRRAADDNIDGGKFGGPILETNGAPVQFPGQGHGALVGAVGDNDAAGAAAEQRARGFLAGFARAEDHDLVLVERTENLPRQFDGDGTDGDVAALDVGLGPNLLGHVECFLEGLVQMGAGLVVLQGRFVGLFELTEDFSLANHHRIKAAGNFEQMLQTFRLSMEINFSADRLAVVVMVEKELPQFLHGLAFGQGGRGVDFHPDCTWKE